MPEATHAIDCDMDEDYSCDASSPPDPVTLEITAAAAHASLEEQLRPVVERASAALKSFEEAVRASVTAEERETREDVRVAEAEVDRAREVLHELVTHPLLLASPGDPGPEVEYLRETCARQQAELRSLRAFAARLEGRVKDLEASERVLRADLAHAEAEGGP